VTLTLPDDVVHTLKAIDQDLSRAIVRLVQPLLTRRLRTSSPVTIIGDRTAVITLNPSRTLEKYTGAELIAMSDGRAIISFRHHASLADFELRLLDAIAGDTLTHEDRALFEELGAVLRNARQHRGVALREQRIILLERAPKVKTAPPKGRLSNKR
jgi:hypothetical protein